MRRVSELPDPERTELMSDDGAQMGVDAESAMNAALGGPQPEKVSTMAETAERIRATTTANSYSEAADYCAHLILDWLEADPSRAQGPTENVYEDDPETGRMAWPAVVLEHGWYDRMKDDGIPLDQLALTGFMWGWAVNAARAIVELPEVPNPAIVTL